MGAFLDKPKTEKHNETGGGNGLRFGLASMQGWRVEMEDAHTAMIGLENGLTDWSFFAVFDGHAGKNVSEYASRKLIESIGNNKDFMKALEQGDPTSPLMIQAIKNGFLELDEKMRKIPEMLNGEDKSGSTAICALVSPTHIYFANCGDSRGLLTSSGAVKFHTQDHKPSNPIEKERIQNAGGSVMIQRVNGSLAVSRALGDYDYKNVEGKSPVEQLVSPEPEINIIARTDQDEFVVLACDGIWDVMTNDDLSNFVRSRIRLTDNLETICNQVIDCCLYKGSRDNMSIVIVALPGAQPVSEDEKKKEQDLDKLLETKIQDIINSSEPHDADLPYIMHVLDNEEIEGLPPGGGLCAKRQTIDSILKRLRPDAAGDSSVSNLSTMRQMNFLRHVAPKK
ncbi:unnamed protein product [Owenia fusiformis]|uniref:Uncharacterized protein n=1 Tax=Owenia fusiformis TaxID=6347 RepID=A0A8J1U744_OWEFU|nr:unnamed protein product [Owenia fusiformis]